MFVIIKSLVVTVMPNDAFIRYHNTAAAAATIIKITTVIIVIRVYDFHCTVLLFLFSRCRSELSGAFVSLGYSF